MMVHASFVAAIPACHAEGRWLDRDPAVLSAPAAFAAFVGGLLARADPATPRAHDEVPSSVYWWTEGTEFLGRITIRHALNDRLREAGGHIGYEVAPAHRRQGHALAMLGAALPVAYGLGLERVLLTCEAGNVGSRRVIEAHGGRLHDSSAGKLRYWLVTGPCEDAS